MESDARDRIGRNTAPEPPHAVYERAAAVLARFFGKLSVEFRATPPGASTPDEV